MSPFLLCFVIASLQAVSSTESSFLGRRAQAQGGSTPSSDGSVGMGAASSNGASTGHTDTSGVNNNHKSDCSNRRLEGEAAAGAGPAAGTSIRTSDECVENNKAAGAALGTVVGIVIAANAFVGLALCLVIYVRRGKMMQDEPQPPVNSAGAEKKVEDPITLGIDESNLAGN